MKVYQVLLNGGLNLQTNSIERAKARAYDLLILYEHKDVKIIEKEVEIWRLENFKTIVSYKIKKFL